MTIEAAKDNIPNHPRSGSMVPVLGNLAGGGSAWAVVAGGSAAARGMKSKAPTWAGVGGGGGGGAWPVTVLLSDVTVSGLSVTTVAETFIPSLKSNAVFCSPLMVNF